jgi:hypothetical protein
MLDLTLLQDGAPAHKATETQEGSETVFLKSKSKTSDPQNRPHLSSIENLIGIFKARVEMSKPYSRNLEYLEATVEACPKMISPETMENLIQSIP